MSEFHLHLSAESPFHILSTQFHSLLWSPTYPLLTSYWPFCSVLNQIGGAIGRWHKTGIITQSVEIPYNTCAHLSSSCFPLPAWSWFPALCLLVFPQGNIDEGAPDVEPFPLISLPSNKQKISSFPSQCSQPVVFLYCHRKQIRWQNP